MMEEEKDECFELPTSEARVQPTLTSNEFLKLFRGKNDTHDLDRERAASILKNLHMPANPKSLAGNPFFNRQKSADRELNLHVQDLFSMGQVESGVMRLNKGRDQHDDEMFEELLLKRMIRNSRKLR